MDSNENDPSGSRPTEGAPGTASNEIDEMTQRFSQQQVMIAQLKEMVLAEETARTQKIADTRLKVEKYTSQLAKIRERSRGNKPQPSKPATDTVAGRDKPNIANVSASGINESQSDTSQSSIGIATPSPLSSKTDKPKLSSREATKKLHQQIKEHKATIAERTKNELELEKALLKIQKQLEENQNAEVIPVKSNINITKLPFSENLEVSQTTSELRNRIIFLESTILDLQETCKEKDSVIKSKTDAITLMSADLSKKGKNTLDLLDDTKEQMHKMQENFLTMENNMKLEKQSLLTELEVHKNKITYLEEANSILEGERFKLTVENNTLEEKISCFETKIQNLNSELLDSANQIKELLSSKDQVIDSTNEEKGTVEIANMDTLTRKIEELEKANVYLKETNEILQEKIAIHTNVDEKITPVKEELLSSTISDTKTTTDVFKTLNSVIESLNQQILDVEVSIKEKECKIDLLKSETIQSESIASNIVSPEKSDEVKDLLEKIKILEDLNIDIKKSNLNLPQKSPSKSPEKLAGSPKSQSKASKQFGKGRKNQKNKLPTEEIKDEPPKYQEILESVESLSNIILNLNTDMCQKRIMLKEKESDLEVLYNSSNKLVSDENKSKNRDEVGESKNISILKDVVDDIEDLDMDGLKGRLDLTLKQIETLTKDLADSNKNMIKLKASHKTKVKQMQKCIDDYSKVSDSNSEVIRLQSEVNALTQKIAELEDDKGNLQLHLVDYDSDRVSDSQLHAKLLDLERIAEERLKAIAELEMQKFQLVQDLHLSEQRVGSLEDKVADLSFLENEHVSAEMKCAQLEEQLESLKSEFESKLLEIEELLSEKCVLASTIENLHKEKSELNNKLELYIQENMDLIDRLDKLSAEKVSSAESIEMVESLTTQEKIEIEQYQKRFSTCETSEKEIDESKEEANANLDKSELQAKIDLYSFERQEVMDKIDHLQMLNNDLTIKLEKSLEDFKKLSEQYDFINNEKENVLAQSKLNEDKIASVTEQIEKLMKENIELKIELERYSKNKTITEVVVSETIEIEDTIEKEIVEPTTQDSLALPVPESTTQTKSSPSKGDKKFTKEILRLKNTLKQKDSEISDLNKKIDEFSSIRESNDQLNNFINNANESLQYFIVHNLCSDGGSLEIQQSSISDKIKFNEDSVTLLQNELQNNKTSLIDMKNKLGDQENVLESTCKNVMYSLDGIISVLNKTLTDNEKEIEDLKTDLSQFGTYSDKMNYLFNELQEKIKILSIILVNNKNEMQDIVVHKNNIELEISQLQKECFNKDEKIKNMNQELHDLDNKLKENSDYEDGISKVTSECEAFKLREVELKTRIDELETELKSRVTLHNDSEQKLSELSIVMSENKGDFEELNSEIAALNNEITTLRLEYGIMQKKLKEACDTITILEPQILDSQSKNCEILTEKDRIASRLESVNVENEQLSSQNAALQKKLLDYDTQLQQLSQENISYLEKLEAKIAECESVRSGLTKINNLEDELIHKQNEMQLLIEQLEGLQNSNKELKCAHDAKTQERDAYIESLETDLNKNKDKISRLENKIALMETLEKKAKKLLMKLQEKDSIIAKKREVEEELRKEINEIQNQSINCDSQIKALTDENNEWKQSLNSWNEEKNSLTVEIENLKSYVSVCEDKLQQLPSLENDRDTYVEKCSLLESNMKKMATEFGETMKQKIVEFEYLESTLHTQTENFDLQCKEFKNQYKKVQDELSFSMQQSADFEKEIHELKNEIEILMGEKSALILKLQSQSSKEKESDLQKQIDNLVLLMNEKDSEIKKYHSLTLQNQDAESIKINKLNEQISNLEAACTEKDLKIQKLDEQFKSCLRQLEEVIGVQQSTKEEQEKLIKLLDEKESLICQLRSENVNPVSAINIIEEAMPKKVVGKQLATASSFFDSIEPQKGFEDLKYIEDQIVSMETAHAQLANVNPEIPMIRAFHHDSPMPVPKSQLHEITSSNEPIVEEVINPRKTFECFVGTDDFIKQEQLFEQNRSSQSGHPMTATDAVLNSKIDELEKCIKSLQEEKEKLLSDLSQSQAKTNKALIKLKEYKNRNDALTSQLKKAKSSSDFDILDGAIQDELTSQIKSLEEKIKEMKSHMDKEKLEKDSMHKRIDVLTTANEKLITTKEKQDIELQMYITRNETLNKKVQNLEWNQDFSEDVEDVKQENSEPKTSSENVESKSRQIDELIEKNKQLQADIEELESILESKCKEIEKYSITQIETYQNLELIKEENIKLKNSLNEVSNEKCLLHSEIVSLQTLISDYQNHPKVDNDEIESFKSKNNELLEKIELLNKECSVINGAKASLEEEKASLFSQYSQLQSTLEELRAKNMEFISLEDHNRSELNLVLAEKNSLNEKLLEIENSLSTVTKENELLINQLKDKSNEMEYAKNDHENILKQNISSLQNEYAEKEYQLLQKISELESKLLDVEKKLESMINSSQSNDSELMEKLLKTEEELNRNLQEMKEMKASYEERLNFESTNLKTLSIEYQNLKKESEEKLSNATNSLQTLQQLQSEKQQLEEIITQKEESLNKYYNFEAMCNNRFNEYNAILNAKDIDISQKNEEIKYLTEEKFSTQNELSDKVNEIHSLTEKIENYNILIKKMSETNEMNNTQGSQLEDMKNKFDEEKTLIESALSETMIKVESLESELRSKFEECASLDTKLKEAQQLVDEEALQMEEMRTALEAQEMEIVTLKENLTEQTNAYGKLQRAYTKGERHISFSDDTKPGDDSVPPHAVEKDTEAEKLSPRADLDLALYMLHQRDVRCEELTLELMHLLEERDTLQLKLSDAIRNNEQMRIKQAQNPSTSQTPETPLLEETATQQISPPLEANSEGVSDTPPKDESLESKLSQIHGMNQMRDVRVKDERESRQRQMELLQRDVQNLPPEAVAQLREAHYTLSRDTQSTSTVLFNWLWGKTTPKVVHM